MPSASLSLLDRGTSHAGTVASMGQEAGGIATGLAFNVARGAAIPEVNELRWIEHSSQP